MSENESLSKGTADRVDRVLALFLADPELLDFCVQHDPDRMHDCIGKLKTHFVDITADEIQEALIKYVERRKPRPGTTRTSDHELEELRAGLQKGLLEVVKQIDSGYRITMGMYTAAFVVGISMLVASIVTALFRETDSAALLGGLGTADVITFLVFKPAQDLQASRGGLAQLQAAFFAWINDVHNWNEYLELLQNESGSVAPSFDTCKQISEIQGRSTERMAQLISMHTRFAPDIKGALRRGRTSKHEPPAGDSSTG